MIGAWYFPSWNGDFRLVEVDDSSYREKASKTRSVLIVDKPTEAERLSLEAFLAKAAESGWTAQEKLGSEERQEILLGATTADAGKVLLTFLSPADRTITAIRSENGKLTVHDTADLLASAPEVLTPEVISTDEVPKEKPTKEKAVSVRRPTPSCPQCVPGAIPMASEVLLSFLTPEEHETWAADRFIVVEGGLTGHRYVLAHRHSPLAVKIGRICFDLDSSCVVHFHDNGVPPEEEVLAAKLILQHREPWLRNEATMLAVTWLSLPDSNEMLSPIGSVGLNGVSSAYPMMVFKNPFGDITDGIWDSKLTSSIGGAVMGALYTFDAMSRKTPR